MIAPGVTPPDRNRGIPILAGAFVLGLALAAAGCSGDAPTASQGDRAARSDADALASIPEYPHKAVCGDVPAGYARCHAHVRVDDQGDVVSNAAPTSGLVPSQLQSAYNVPPTGGSGVTVAIVDTYDDPNAESDLALYRSTFGLPPCTTANGCFRKVNESGASSPLPGGNTGWGVEISLALDMVSAACPECSILLVEASSADIFDLGAAENTAVALGAGVVSNSYGGSESSADSVYDAYFDHPGVTITASAGDSGYGVEYPASSFYVVAVGGTTLTTSSSPRGWIEAAWSGGGSGCSADTAKPKFQSDTGCSRRTVVDVSAVANPSTGVAVYDTYGEGGWLVVGGTSVASPLFAGILAAAGETTGGNGWPYAHTGDFYDVTTGSNGTCSPAYLCTAGTGYDGPTGWGTPNGMAIAGSGSSTSSTSSASASSSASSSSSSGGSACAHGICSTGGRLSATCDPCVSEICAKRPLCCFLDWSTSCVNDVKTICGETCP
jgi:subtilase family serine protease